MRLDKLLADCGFGTRTEVKKLIKSGSVSVEGQTKITPELHIDPETANVFVNGQRVLYKKFVYIMMNKPSGYISATFDKKLPTVIDLLPEEVKRFNPFPVGRLDIDTEGLLLLTNDGELSHNLLSPKKHVKKTYLAQLEKPFKEDYVKAFKEGIDLEDFKTLPAEIYPADENDPFGVEIVICEGKFHQVKRMVEAVSNKVVFLKRIKMKNLSLDPTLEVGQFRELTVEELNDLQNFDDM